MRSFLASVGLILMVSSASAQNTQCDRRQAVADYLGTFDETRTAQGISSDNLLVEVWANTETGTWTLTVTTPQGVTCLLAFGGFYETVREGPTF